MKIALIGGHLAPALALIDAAPENTAFIFFGRKHTMEGDSALSLEYRTITDLNIPFLAITTGRLQRNLNLRSMLSLMKIPYGIRQALRMLREHRPDVVIGFGGYVSVPVCLAAYILRIPVIIHEQTLGIGIANKFIAKFATKICLSWQHSEQFFPKGRTIVTGNPVRQWKMEDGKLKIEKKTRPLLYITGGSTGAHAINVLVEECLESLVHDFDIIHQTGDSKEFRDFDRLSKIRAGMIKKFQERYHMTKFVPPAEVGVIMQQADFVISRAGMNTVTELLYFGKPCLLIPIPVGQKNEQLMNARFLKKTGIGDYAHQGDLTPDIFLKKVRMMVEHRAKYQVHAHDAKTLVRSDAASRIMKIAYEIADRKK
jgi:UDP-N-acetylglucosamine--N-acetylmuramyl-(pentapeptide) pyrophosphoryl-undecaprenol N-acetylglucosamine transferase